MKLRNENPRIALFLNINNIFDEMFDIKENIHLWVYFTHAEELVTINHEQFVFRNQTHK